MSFKLEIAKLIIDKILLGSIIGIAVWIGTYQMERIKIEEGFRSELNKARVEKIAEVWETAANFEADFYKLYDAVESERIRMMFIDRKEITEKEIYSSKNVKPYVDLVVESRSVLFAVIRKNSFYLGSKLADQVFEFHRSLAFIDLYQKISLDKSMNKDMGNVSIDDIRARVDLFRANIAQIRDYLIEGGR